MTENILKGRLQRWSWNPFGYTLDSRHGSYHIDPLLASPFVLESFKKYAMRVPL